MKWDIDHTHESVFWFLPAIAYEIWSIGGEFTQIRLKLIHECNNKMNLIMRDLILSVLFLKMQSSEIRASDIAISVKNQMLELAHDVTQWIYQDVFFIAK